MCRCLLNGVQEQMATQGLAANLLKLGESSSVWEQNQQIGIYIRGQVKIKFRRRLLPFGTTFLSSQLLSNNILCGCNTASEIPSKTARTSAEAGSRERGDVPLVPPQNAVNVLPSRLTAPARNSCLWMRPVKSMGKVRQGT
jgi:hypothetical protein